jgi:hypothetical protein
MHDAAAGRHPLHAAVLQQALVPGAVAMPHAAGDHVGDGLEAAVRVLGKAADVVVGVVGAEGIEHQERVETALQRLRQYAHELDAGAIGGRGARDDALDVARPSDALESQM